MPLASIFNQIGFTMTAIMTVKEYNRLSARDFENGAVQDEIARALEDRERLISDDWYTERAMHAYLKREKPNLLAYAGWITEQLQAAFLKGKQIGQGEQDRLDYMQGYRAGQEDMQAMAAESSQAPDP